MARSSRIARRLTRHAAFAKEVAAYSSAMTASFPREEVIASFTPPGEDTKRSYPVRLGKK